jgi:hypothetical protein
LYVPASLVCCFRAKLTSVYGCFLKRESAADPFIHKNKEKYYHSLSYPASGASSVPIQDPNLAGWKPFKKRNCRFKNGGVLRSRKNMFLTLFSATKAVSECLVADTAIWDPENKGITYVFEKKANYH